MGMSQLEGEFAHYCLVSPQCQSSSECGAGEVGKESGWGGAGGPETGWVGWEELNPSTPR